MTPEFQRWLKALPPEKANRVSAAMDAPQEGGTTMGRPLVDRIKGSRLHNLKELRTGSIRGLFVFQPTGPFIAGGWGQARRPEWLVPAGHPRRRTALQQVQRRQRKGGAPVAPRSTGSWQVVRGELPIDELRVAAYRRILEAQHRIAAARTPAGVSDADIDAALEACEPPDPAFLGPHDLYLTTIEGFVTALGGRLDVAAAFFGEERINLPPPG